MLRVVDQLNHAIEEPYLLYLPGWTWERYLAEAPEYPICEYERGYLVMHSPADWGHQAVVGFVHALLDLWCHKTGRGIVGLGPAGVRVEPEVGREPDVFVVPPEQADRLHGKSMEVVPTLIVEVASPDTRLLDLSTKAQEYAALGVPEYWAVDLGRKLVVRHLLEGGRYRPEEVRAGRLASHALPGFWVEVDWLWSNPPPDPLECLKQVLGVRSL